MMIKRCTCSIHGWSSFKLIAELFRRLTVNCWLENESLESRTLSSLDQWSKTQFESLLSLNDFLIKRKAQLNAFVQKLFRIRQEFAVVAVNPNRLQVYRIATLLCIQNGHTNEKKTYFLCDRTWSTSQARQSNDRWESDVFLALRVPVQLRIPFGTKDNKLK
jgi:hypothetical protein